MKVCPRCKQNKERTNEARDMVNEHHGYPLRESRNGNRLKVERLTGTSPLAPPVWLDIRRDCRDKSDS